MTTDGATLSITNATFKAKIDVADFSFTSCRTICQYENANAPGIWKDQDDTRCMILSRTIEPEYETVALPHDLADDRSSRRKVLQFPNLMFQD